MTLPPGCTDDMNIVLPEHRTLEQVVDLVISLGREGLAPEQVESTLIETFCLSPYDAALAWDRVHGGIARASTKNRANCPDRVKDPLAWLSFQRASQDWPISRLRYAKSESVNPWWKFW